MRLQLSAVARFFVVLSSGPFAKSMQDAEVFHLQQCRCRNFSARRICQARVCDPCCPDLGVVPCWEPSNAVRCCGAPGVRWRMEGKRSSAMFSSPDVSAPHDRMQTTVWPGPTVFQPRRTPGRQASRIYGLHVKASGTDEVHYILRVIVPVNAGLNPSKSV